MSKIEIEKLGAFYLGREMEGEEAKASETPLLYDAKDLTTHGLIVGMTGSGKTGLGIVLLEEAAIDGVPAIVIDPKGDMANLALRFPGLSGPEFRPWIDEAEATRAGETPDAFAAETAARWKQGLTDWGQSPGRVAELARSAEVTLFTPGSGAGRGVRLLKAFAAPSASILQDGDALRERILGAVSGLMGLLHLDIDPVTSREHILLSKLLEQSWRKGDDLDLESIIRQIQEPPFKTLGVMDLESIFPAKDRFGLAMRLNNLLASPAFRAWREGEPLDVQRLLFTESGRPRLSVFSIAHLSDEERMFFVTLLLGEVVSWMRSSQGTGSLRALLYMDEIAGFFPPVSHPPSKGPMLTLLKQARAFGLGVVLATQNPVDLDYKGLANIGTWFLGRLQTKRDKDRLLEGLTAANGGASDRGELSELLSSLTQRVFLMRNVHEDRPVLFQTRWALSYLRGPMTREQIASLTAERSKGEASSRETETSTNAPAAEALRSRPVLPPNIDQCHLAVSTGHAEEAILYRPALVATAEIHYVHARYRVDHWESLVWLTHLEEDSGAKLAKLNWDGGESLGSSERQLEESPSSPSAESRTSYSELPEPAANEKNYAKWRSEFLRFLYKERVLKLWRAKALKQISEPMEAEGDFRARLCHRLREQRDEEIEKLRKQFAPKLARLEERIRQAESRVEREAAQYGSQKVQSAISVGASLVGALFGRKLASATNLRRAATAARSASRISKEKLDIAEANRDLAARKSELLELSRELEEKTRPLRAGVDPQELELENLTVRLSKTDTAVTRLALAWAPWGSRSDGRLHPLYRD